MNTISFNPKVTQISATSLEKPDAPKIAVRPEIQNILGSKDSEKLNIVCTDEICVSCAS